jgi:hypothetical protein
MRALVLCLLLPLGCVGDLDEIIGDPPLPENPTGKWNGPEDGKCWTSPAPTLFGNAVCLCDGLADAGAMLVKTGPGVAGANFGANGKVVLANHTHVDGAFTPYGGLEAGGNVEVRDAALSAKNVSVAGRLDVGKDLSVGGDLLGLGVVSVGGALRVAGSNLVLGSKKYSSLAAYAAPAGPPCACGASETLDVRAAVEAARGANDNAHKGLPTNLADIGASELELSSGKYFFDNILNIGKLRLNVSGTVALYLAGNVDSVGAERIKLQPGATLDLYVSGWVRSVGHAVMGEKEAPGAFRLYVGGAEPLMITVGNAEFNGVVYAPAAPLTYVGRTVVRGGLFAKTLSSAGLLELYYSRPDQTPPAQKLCPPKQPPSTPPGGKLPDPDAIYSDPK